MANEPHDVQTVRSNGIYHGLPVLSEDHVGLNAIVVGASSMSGQSMIDILLRSPKRWKKVYALSRRAPLSSDAEHVPIDLLKEPQEIAAKLKKHDVKA